jgi:hypothetical protein
MARSSRKESMDNAHRNKDDEYYTLFQDIADEVSLYREQLRGKRILCPCDWDESYDEEIVFKEENHIISTALFNDSGTVRQIDIEQTKAKIEKDLNLVKCNFVKYLVAHADDFGIKSISASGYDPATGKGIRFQDIDYSRYDVVITNPPFSLFREFVDLLMKNKKEFIVIGPQTAISYKEIFPYIKNNQLWLGYHYHLTGFLCSDGTVLKKNDALPRCCCWFTNLDVSYRHENMILTEDYTPEKYPKYANYNGIDVNKSNRIPCDYDGNMGVPITFLQKYNPNQFEIVSFRKGDDGKDLMLENGKPLFVRLLIRKK